MNNRMYRIILALVMSLLCTGTFSQERTITVSGTVTDENGEPLPGAGVLIEGTSSGEITDLDGKYSIRVGSQGALVFSFIGYRPVTLSVRGRDKMNVSLEPDRTILDEAVVVGYGTMKRSDLTGSVSSVGAKAIESFKTGTVLEALGGQIAGVNITAADGTPGGDFDIKIRGVGTVNGDSSPLYIVDGFEVDNISFLANQDIASIDVLKDASASAIYGARAANGVVLVTTKSGRNGRTEVSYNGSASYRTLSRQLDVLDPYEFVKLQLELNPTRYADRYFKVGEDANGKAYRFQSLDDYMGADTGIDWQYEAFRPTWSQSHDVSVIGGNADTQYSVSFSHFDEAGIFESNTFRKDNARVKFSQKIFRWLKLDASVNYTRSKDTGIGTGGSTLSNIIQYRPVGGLYVSDWQLRYNMVDPMLEEVGLSSSNYFNPILNAETVDQVKNIDQWIANASLSFNLAKGLTFRTSASYNTAFRRDDVFYGSESSNAIRGSGPYGSSKTTRTLRWSNSNVLSYDRTFAKKHTMQLTLGHEVSYSLVQFLSAEAREFPLDALGVDNLGLGAVPSAVSTGKTDNRRLSFFARGFYNYDDRYMLTATVRADASTVFSDSHKWGCFPSFSAAWNIANEHFMDGVAWLPNLKLRAGWGVVGNDRISSYLSLDLYNPLKYGAGSSQVTVLQPSQLSNKDLKWEGAMTTNAGIDMGFWDNRLNITVDGFIKDSRDLLLAQNLSLVTGFESQWQNVGKLRNKGIEISISSVNFNRRHFFWSTDFNISFIRNTLVALQDGSDYILSRSGFNSNFASYDYIAQVGQPIGSMYGYVFDGIYQYSDFDIYADGTMHLKPGVPDISEHAGETVSPGFVKYRDIDGDGIITAADRTIIGNGQPDWFGGITNSFQFYGVDFSFMLQFTYGNDVYNAQRMFSTQSRLEMQNFLGEVRDRWTASNASSKVPSAKGYVAYDVYSRFIEDGSFLRLKNITLGYTVPERLTRKMYVSKLRVYASAQNLFCLTGYSGYDPEVNMKSTPLMPSFDYGAYPRSRVFTFGLELKF